MTKNVEVFYGGAKESFELNDDDKLTIGRLGDIKIPEIYNFVSRYHGEFREENGETSYTDHSKFGTGVLDKYVNNKFDCLVLEEGDVVKELPSGKNWEYTMRTSPKDDCSVINNEKIDMHDRGPVLFFGQSKPNWNGPLAFVKQD